VRLVVDKEGSFGQKEGGKKREEERGREKLTKGCDREREREREGERRARGRRDG